METLPQVLDGFAVVLEPMNLLFCLVGVVIGMFIGVLPGLGPTATISILLPITYAMDDSRDHHARRHLLRVDLWRNRDGDPAEAAW